MSKRVTWKEFDKDPHRIFRMADKDGPIIVVDGDNPDDPQAQMRLSIVGSMKDESKDDTEHCWNCGVEI